MKKSKWKIPSKAISQTPQSDGKYLKESFAQQKDITFGFKHMDVNRSKFACKAGHGQALIKILNCFCLYSQFNQMKMGQTKNYHPLDENVIKKHNLKDLQDKSPSRRLHQMGKQRTSERIVGFFERDPNNLFQVCILDLDHQIYPQH